MNKNTFTLEDHKTALEFARAMGLTTGTEKESAEMASALDFAVAMGLKKRPMSERNVRDAGVAVLVPQLRFS